MKDFKDKNNGNKNSAGDSRQFPPDPAPQASDNPSVSHKMLQSAEIIHNTKIPVPVNNTALLPNQFMGTGRTVLVGFTRDDDDSSWTRDDTQSTPFAPFGVDHNLAGHFYIYPQTKTTSNNVFFTITGF